MTEEKLVDVENMRWEYREVAAAHRFYVGLRFIIVAFTVTMQSGVLNFYTQSHTAMLAAIEAKQQPQQIEALERITLTPIIGLITIIAVFFMEGRNVNLLRTMIKRGRELEAELHLKNGAFNRLTESRSWRTFATYTRGITLVYLVIGGVWVLLFIRNW